MGGTLLAGRRHSQPGSQMTDVDEKWDAYPNTVLEFPVAAGTPARIDLRRPVDTRVRDTLAQLGLTGSFAIFTAQNPNGDNADDAPTPAAERAREVANARRAAALEEWLERRGIPFRQVDGVAPDGSYRERCVAAAMDRDVATAIATDLDQLALFWFDGDAFWLHPAEADAEPVRLPAG